MIQQKALIEACKIIEGVPKVNFCSKLNLNVTSKKTFLRPKVLVRPAYKSSTLKKIGDF